MAKIRGTCIQLRSYGRRSWVVGADYLLGSEPALCECVFAKWLERGLACMQCCNSKYINNSLGSAGRQLPKLWKY
eukprot:2375816-Amphidinium_carterae.1